MGLSVNLENRSKAAHPTQNILKRNEQKFDKQKILDALEKLSDKEYEKISKILKVDPE